LGRNTDDIRRMAASTRRDPFKGKNEMAGVFRFGRRITPVAPVKPKAELPVATTPDEPAANAVAVKPAK